MATPIVVQNLTKQYDTATALSGISMTVEAGEIMGFLGPNGAGKTTTLRILTGFLAPTKGTVQIEGQSVIDHPVSVRRRIGYLPENVSLYPELRVREYLHYRSCIKGIAPKERSLRIAEVLERCALKDAERQLIGRLSKGFRQRVALADCLIGRPPILILDEPTVGLDPHQIRQTRDLIKELGKDTTILLSTHILPEVEMICDRVTIIDRGKIVAVDSPAQLRQRLQAGRTLRVQLRAGEPSVIASALQGLAGVEQVTILQSTDGTAAFELLTAVGKDVREAVFQLAVEHRWVLRELAQSQASLEDVFIQLTTKEQDA
ncbi:MAG: ABC transporter ATP-binding protein [Candidatus Omnitrophica bacterium]|nr:ABC transporter ATP-binding protein [Candidatus Omnitrophota bacterium]